MSRSSGSSSLPADSRTVPRTNARGKSGKSQELLENSLTPRRGRPKLAAMRQGIAKRIETRLEELDLSVDAGAERCGLNPWNLYDILRGKSRSPTFNVMVAISRGLDIPLDDFADAAHDPEGSDDTTPLELTPPVDSDSGHRWNSKAGRKQATPSPAT